jgi:hypothetical protein
MSYTSKLNLCLSQSTSLGGSDTSAAKALPTRRLTDRINFALAGYGLLAGGSVSAAEPANIVTEHSSSTVITTTIAKNASISYIIRGG